MGIVVLIFNSLKAMLFQLKSKPEDFIVEEILPQ
jgi:hypothetical protein